MTESNQDIQAVGEILKVDSQHRVVYGWASVIEKNGQRVIDTQGDVLEEDELLKSAHQYVLDERAGKVMHKGAVVADVVESIVFSKDVQKALSIDLGKVGWFIGMKIRDEELWKKCEAGEFSSFSVGGRGRRIPIA